MINLLFLCLFALYVLCACLRAQHKQPGAEHKTSRLSLIVQTPLFLLACYIGAAQGVFSRGLVSLPALCAGLLLGHLVFSVSLSITHRGLGDAARHCIAPSGLLHFLVETPNLLFRFLLVSVTEELIYRVAAQTLLIGVIGRPVLAIGIVALLFSLAHGHFLRSRPADSLEFIAFAALLGALYYATNSFLLVATLHTVRNLEIVFLEYRGKLDELGGDVQAIEAIERAYAFKHSERS